MRTYPYCPSFYFLFFCYAAGLLWGLSMDGTGFSAAWREVAGGWCQAILFLFFLCGIWLLAVRGLGRGSAAVRAATAVGLALCGGYANSVLSREADGRLPETCLDERKRAYDVVVLDFGKETAKSWKKTVRVLAYGGADGEWHETRAKLCLYFQKDSGAGRLAPGDRLTVHAAPQPMDTASYAGYARYMRRKHVYASAYVPKSGWRFAGEGGESDSVAAVVGASGRHPAHRLRRAAGRLQARLAIGLEHPCLSERESGIAKALVFGDRSDMDPEIGQAYRHAGVVHVLCVSGMHLGILAWLLMALLKGLGGRFGPWIRFGVVCMFLWGYALVTGLSASVCRAACMFTFVQAGLCFGRRLPVGRALLLSAWLLLLLRPDWLLDLGFLLSYMAVGGIVFLTPRNYPAVMEKRRLLKKIVAMSAVSWAAQCATGPLSLYCFGQFPVYFWVANLVAAPLASVLLPVGMVAGLVGLSATGSHWLTRVPIGILQWGITLMNDMVLCIERWPRAVWSIALPGLACIGLYAVLYCVRQAVVQREKRYLPYAGGLLWMVCCMV